MGCVGWCVILCDVAFDVVLLTSELIASTRSAQQYVVLSQDVFCYGFKQKIIRKAEERLKQISEIHSVILYWAEPETLLP